MLGDARHPPYDEPRDQALHRGRGLRPSDHRRSSAAGAGADQGAAAAGRGVPFAPLQAISSGTPAAWSVVTADVDGDGYGLGVSFEIGDNFFGFASYVTSDFDFGVELNQLQAGLGYRLGVTDNTDVFASLAYVDAEVEAAFFGSADDSGYGVTIGVRSNVSDLIELFGEVAYVDLGGGSDGTAIGGGIWFNLTDNFALGLGAAFDDDVTSYGASARFYFGM